MQAAVKQAPEYGQLFQNLEREPTLFGSELPENTMETEVQDDINSTVEPVAVKARIAMPVPEPEENIRASGIRKESGEDSLKVSNKKSSKKECAIDQIIVFYDDRTFIAYSPGN
jgi:hypothetical protein